jgi:hypothetical protein
VRRLEYQHQPQCPELQTNDANLVGDPGNTQEAAGSRQRVLAFSNRAYRVLGIMGFCRQPFQKDFHVRNERDRARFGASLVLRILTANVTGAATWRRFRGFGFYKVTEFQFGHAKDVRFHALTIELAVHLYPAVEFARIDELPQIWNFRERPSMVGGREVGLAKLMGFSFCCNLLIYIFCLGSSVGRAVDS